MFNAWLRGYEWSLDKVLKYKPVDVLITLATLVGTVWLYIIVPKGFFPTEDTGFLVVSTEAATDTSFEAMVERQAKIVGNHPPGQGRRLCQFDGRVRRTELHRQ